MPVLLKVMMLIPSCKLKIIAPSTDLSTYHYNVLNQIHGTAVDLAVQHFMLHTDGAS